MEGHVHTVLRSSPSGRWFLLTLSVLVSFVLLSAILLSFRTVEAEPLAPAANISGTVVQPSGSPITQATWVCLKYLHSEGWPDDVECKDSLNNGNFDFTSPIPNELLPGDFFVWADAPSDSSFYPSLLMPFHIASNGDNIALGPVTLTYASFAGLVYEPGGGALADAGWVSLIDEEWNDIVGGDYQTGTYALGGVPAGHWDLVAHPPEDSPFWHSPPRPVTVTPGSQYDPAATQAISLELTLAQLLVYVDDLYTNPITANVHVWNDWGFDMWRRATPDHPASFGDLEVGEVYMIQAWPDWTDIPALANSTVVTITSEADPISRTLALQEPDVVGTVETPEGDPLPQAYEGEDPIPHPAYVHIHSLYEGLDVEMMTNPAGEFGLALPPGEYVVEAHPYANLAFTYTKSLPEYFALGGTLIPPEVDLGYINLTYPSVDGWVFTPLGADIPDCVSVWLEDMAGDWAVGDWYCGGQEWPFRLGGVPEGDYWLLADGLPEYGLFPPEPVVIYVGPDTQYDPAAKQTQDLYLTGAQLYVAVEYPPGTRVNAHVMLWDKYGFEAWSDSTPEMPAQFGAVEPGDYRILAWPTWQDIPALANSNAMTVHIPPGAAPFTRTLFLNIPDITGTVETPEGNPLPPARDEEGNLTPHPAEVHVNSENWDVDMWATTNPTGEFSLSLRDGDFILLAEPMHDLVFRYTKSEPVPFTLSPAISRPLGLGYIPLTYPRIWGTVLDQYENPVETWVNVWSDDGDYWDGDDTYWYAPDRLKPFRFGGLPEGDFYVQAEPPADNPEGYGPSEVFAFSVPPTLTQQITLSLGSANVLGEVRLPPSYPHCPDCPVPWVDVIIQHDPDDGFERWATTGNDGRFAFRVPSDDDYVLYVELPPELLAEWGPPPPEFFTLGPPPDQFTPILYLEPSVEGLLVTGFVDDPQGDPPPPNSTWVELCNDEGLCFDDQVTANGQFTVPVLPGIYHVWVGVDPSTGLLPPLDNGFPILVDDDIDLGGLQLRSAAERTAHVSGRVILRPSGVGLRGIKVEGWTDKGDWNITDSGLDGNYELDLLPGHWHGGPVLTPAQEKLYIVLPPRHRDGYLGPEQTATNVNFDLALRNAAIRGQVVELGQTAPITDIKATVFAEYCLGDECGIVDESPVEAGSFDLRVRKGYTYTLGIWLESEGYMPGPPVTVTAGVTLTTGVRVPVIEAGTRLWGRLMDRSSLEYVELDAIVFGHNPDGVWVEDVLHRGDDPYQYNLYVPTPVDEPITWTLKLGVHPSTGYIPDPAKPKYEIVVEPGETRVGRILYVKELDTFITGTVGIQVGNTFTPTPHLWVFAEGSITATEDLYFETQADANGVYTIPVVPGEYLVGAYMPPSPAFAAKFLPALPKPWTSMEDNPVNLVFRNRPPKTAELQICGALSVLPAGSLSDTVPILVFGWSEDGDFAEVTGTIDSGYCMTVFSNTVWYLWAAYEDLSNNAYYFSQEERVRVGAAAATGVDLVLRRGPYELPDPECWTFDPSRFKRISLPPWGNLPEPLMEIQADTMPVTDTVQICATPVIAMPGGQYLLGFAYEIEARDSAGNLIEEDFDKEIRLIFYLDEDTVREADPEDLELGFYSTARQDWVPLDSIFYEWDDPYWFITGKIDHLSRMGIRSGAAASEIYLPLILRNMG
jgi:hypothetical protein